MIDLELLRKEPEKIIALIAKKDPSFDGKKLYMLDSEVRELRKKIEDLRCVKNDLAERGKREVTEELRQESKRIGKELKELEEKLEKVEQEFRTLYMHCPNLPFDNLPLGGKEANKAVKVFGKQQSFTFAPKNHVELGTKLGWLDFEAATRMTGANFALYKGDAVKMMYALTMFMLKNNMAHGYEVILPPYLVNETSLEVASNFPKFKDQVFAVPGDALFLTPTAEVNLTNMYRKYIFSAEQLPIRMTAWTSCFRREAGAYGATERGLIRMHEFEKVELYAICTPDNSAQEHERMLACAETILQKLGLHYRVSLLATQDCSFPSAKTYDLEVWLPGQKAYYEVSSVSNCTDFQARRGLIRYKESQEGKTQLVHTLNGSSLALSRLMVALMEVYQQEDGSISIPDVLKTEGIF